MSTEHHDPYELEYGSTPPGAKYEHTDIDPAIGYKFALWLSVAMVLSFAIVYGTFVFFERKETTTDRTAQQFPLAAQPPGAARVVREQPTPALQTQPFRDVYSLRQGEAEKLNSFGWVDKEGGVAHIPIDVAMEALLKKGLPARTEGGNALDVVVQDSSSGRTTVRR